MHTPPPPLQELMPDLEPADSDASHWLFDPGPSFLYSGTQFPPLLNKESKAHLLCG